MIDLHRQAFLHNCQGDGNGWSGRRRELEVAGVEIGLTNISNRLSNN
jgi:hypothetical protein